MRQAATALLIFSLAACGGPARLPLEAGIGPNPQLPPPEQALIPAVKVFKASGWPAGIMTRPIPNSQCDAVAHPALRFWL